VNREEREVEKGTLREKARVERQLTDFRQRLFRKGGREKRV
jgi:hypothetical protein